MIVGSVGLEQSRPLDGSWSRFVTDKTLLPELGTDVVAEGNQFPRLLALLNGS